jgi:chitin synthase
VDLRAYLEDYYKFAQTDEEEDEDDKKHLQPHVYELAAKAYYYLRRTSQDQAILFQSAAPSSATGQSEQRRLATRALLSLSSNPAEPNSKSSRVAKQISAAEFIVDAFGCLGSSSTQFSNPRFGRYTELQFRDRGRIAGYKTLLYNLDLDTGRIGFGLEGVNAIHNKERSFNALRWLVAGASPDERNHLRLPEPGTGGLESPEQQDRERFGLLKQAFKTFGFPKKAGEYR